MKKSIIERFDRMDESFTMPKRPVHAVVEEDMRGKLNLKNDRSQHRRYTAFYNDLQN